MQVDQPIRQLALPAFRDLGDSYIDQVARKRSAAKLVQHLSNSGYDVMLVPRAV